MLLPPAVPSCGRQPPSREQSLLLICCHCVRLESGAPFTACPLSFAHFRTCFFSPYYPPPCLGWCLACSDWHIVGAELFLAAETMVGNTQLLRPWGEPGNCLETEASWLLVTSNKCCFTSQWCPPQASVPRKWLSLSHHWGPASQPLLWTKSRPCS